MAKLAEISQCSYLECKYGVLNRASRLSESERRHAHKYHGDQIVKILCPFTARLRRFTRDPLAEMKYVCDCDERLLISCSFKRHCKSCPVFNGRLTSQDVKRRKSQKLFTRSPLESAILKIVTKTILELQQRRDTEDISHQEQSKTRTCDTM